VNGRAALAAGLWLAAAAPAGAYQRDEHYFTVHLALASLRPRIEGEDVVAFCAQLADEAPELNAIQAYERLMRHPLDYAAWSMVGRGSDANVGRMVTIQQLLHGLTGGAPAAVRVVATAAARASLSEVEAARGDPARRTDALCALGFALHLYGDSFAHRRIKNPRRMYQTGIGHLFDASKPDFPLARLALWREYVGSLRTLFPSASAETLDPLLASAEEPSRSARSANAYGRGELIRLETAELVRRGASPAPMPINAAKVPCQPLADAYAARRGWKSAPSCERAWALYRREAEEALAAYDAEPAHAGEPSRPDCARSFYDGPLFDGGAR